MDPTLLADLEVDPVPSMRVGTLESLVQKTHIQDGAVIRTLDPDLSLRFNLLRIHARQ